MSSSAFTPANNLAIPATTTQAGTVSTVAQSFAGVKTFTNGISLGNETLSAYDEGIWIPTLQFGGATTGITYGSNRFGHYTRIGNRCFFNCYFTLTSKGTATGMPIVAGLPFTSASSTNGGVSTVTLWSSGFSTTGSIQAYVGFSESWISFDKISTTAAAQDASIVTNTDFSNTASIMISGHYVVA